MRESPPSSGQRLFPPPLEVRDRPIAIRSERSLCYLPLLQSFWLLPSARFAGPEDRFDHRHISNRVFQRHWNFAPFANRAGERIHLQYILVANRNCLYPDSSSKDIASIINKNSRCTIRRGVKRDLDLDAPGGPQKLHSLV